MKRLFCFAIILVLFVSILSISQAQGENGYEEILNVFEKTNSNFEGYYINGHVEISDRFLEFKEMEEIIDSLNSIYGIRKSDLNYTKSEENGFRQMYTYTQNENLENVSVIVQSQLSENVEETHIIIDIQSNQVYKSIVSNYEKVRDILSKYSEKVDIYTCLIGSYEGNVDYINKANYVLKKLGAEKVEEIIDDRFISLTGYTKNIKEYISFAKRKVNVNVSVRYSEYDNKTYIYIGTPLIVLEY
ncbi:TATA-box binding [Alkalithermobacter thermoalcaliphilus JW-YL-7 = DSM 7308]|uniref:TATA-box binding n=1 Tax=Alkalithermobacter thermoalcaliphilus JW-YL-7 = DSM 7308 TaxID=1121328 RepID=A0A150FN30_CLOPD|nr:protein of unknown function DUF1779 [[Clostridium] paradoxum JW-YL-7 = DSM 7308]SHL04910.1 TATA-box binding [[Clostridium] paradoxum JW-YL-7 = DSM 7308]